MTLWIVASQSPLSLEFSRQEYGSELSRPSPEDLPNPGIQPESPASPTLAGGFFTTAPRGKSSKREEGVFKTSESGECDSPMSVSGKKNY